MGYNINVDSLFNNSQYNFDASLMTSVPSVNTTNSGSIFGTDNSILGFSDLTQSIWKGYQNILDSVSDITFTPQASNEESADSTEVPAQSSGVSEADNFSSLTSATSGNLLQGKKITPKMSDSQQKQLDKFIKIYNENKAVYQRISDRVKKETGAYIPPQLIAAIHYRESGCKFDTYLHNGQKLGKPTTCVPRNILFYNFEDAAVHALKSMGLSKVQSGQESYLRYAERFNGLGYAKRGIASPYIWAGTTNYTGGMYVRDGVFSSSAKDKRIGVALMLEGLNNQQKYTA